MKIEIEGDSEAAVALALLQMVAEAEGKLAADGEWKGADRAWILDTYAECLSAVDGLRDAELVVDEEDDEDEDDLDEGDGDDEDAIDEEDEAPAPKA